MTLDSLQQTTPEQVAADFRNAVRAAVSALPEKLRLIGLIATESAPSLTYSNYTRAGCDDVGIEFELRHVSRLELETEIERANADPNAHGIMIYYPVFGTDRDRYLKDVVDFRKDVEGLTNHWVHRLYANQRWESYDRTRKAILPCTPLGIVKILEAVQLPLNLEGGLNLVDLNVAIFNRSEVVGRPLAQMLANDGAQVWSFDLNGTIEFTKGQERESTVGRAEALKTADIVITGVPNRNFPLIAIDEIPRARVRLNFSTVQNFHPNAACAPGVFVPRVGPVTVAMCLRNTLQLYRNFHRPES